MIFVVPIIQQTYPLPQSSQSFSKLTLFLSLNCSGVVSWLDGFWFSWFVVCGQMGGFKVVGGFIAKWVWFYSYMGGFMACSDGIKTRALITARPTRDLKLIILYAV